MIHWVFDRTAEFLEKKTQETKADIQSLSETR